LVKKTLVKSAFRKHYSVETAIVEMYNDLLESIDNNKVRILVMIDLSAAFHTIDIPILIQMLKDEFGIDCTPLKWIESFLSNRTIKVLINRSSSDSEPV
jgi:hypothetical protein